jgi:hypothetical protein
VQYKVNNEEAVRPFYTSALFLVGIITVVLLVSCKSVQRCIREFYLSPGAVFFYILLGYILWRSCFSGERQIKDALYLVYWMTFVPFTLLIFLKIKKGKDYLLGLSKIILWFALFASVVAHSVFFEWFNLEIYNYVLVQNYWTPFRIHGFMGEPTTLGGLIGCSIIFLSYLREHEKSWQLFFTKWFLFATLVACGSRSTIVALLIAYIPFCISLKFRMVSVIKIACILTLGLIVLAVLLLANANMDILSLNRGDLALNNEQNRLFVWSTVGQFFLNQSSLISIMFGEGNGGLVNIYRSAFNTVLHILYDYGLVGMLLYLFVFFYSLYIGAIRYLDTKSSAYKLGLRLLIYGFVFNIFNSSFLTFFFNFQTLCFILGMLVVNISRDRNWHMTNASIG